MKKIIMFQGDIETQGYFSLQMEKAFRKLGHEVFVYDLSKPWSNSGKLLRFVERHNTVVISFNFHGMSGEVQFRDDAGVWFWDAFEIPCYNIVVDHPMYYYKFLRNRPKQYIHISIDKKQEEFMSTFFPEVKSLGFLPLAGTSLTPSGNYLPIADRAYDIVFTGNYSAPERFEKYMKRLGPEYEAFYRGMVDDLLANDEKEIMEVAISHIKREIPDVTHEELKETMQNLTFIDLYVRHTLRRDVVKSLVDAGIKVHVFGDKWHEMECKHPENLINGDSLFSEECLEMIGQAKISLNVLPWFKEGAHDRIYNSMCNGAVCLTDSNQYLDGILKDDVNCRIFKMGQLEKLPEIVSDLLDSPDKMQAIADNGFCMAMANETWEKRCEYLHKIIEEA